jgi:hypothetical protein
VTATNTPDVEGTPDFMGRKPSTRTRRHANGKRRDQPDTTDGPAAFDWIVVGERRMFVVGYTAGGAPYGCFEEESDDDASDGVAADPLG